MGTSATRRPWRYGQFGKIFLSYDFYVGVPLGAAIAAPVAFSASTRDSVPGMLIGVAGLGVAIATLVLASLTLLLTTMSREYRDYLQQTPKGTDTLAKPYKFVVALAATSSVLALLAATLAPLTSGRLVVDDADIGAAITVAPALMCSAWSILGCVQVTSLLIYHWKQSEKAVELEERRRRALSRTAG